MRYYILAILAVAFLASSYGDRTMDKIAAELSADVEAAAGDENALEGDAARARACNGDADCLIRADRP